METKASYTDRPEDDGINQEFENSDLKRDFDRTLIPFVLCLFKDGDYVGAFDSIQKFYLDNKEQDEHGLLKRKCDGWIASALEEQEEYDKALLIYTELSQSMKSHYVLFINRRIDVIRCLHKMGRYEEAISETEKTLEEQLSSDTFDILRLLTRYVAILESSGKLFPEQYSSFVKAVGNELSINLSMFNLSESTDLNEAVKLISQKNRDANRRYSHLVMELDGVENDEQAARLLKRYISEEFFDFYRNLAIEELNELGESETFNS